MKTMLSILCLLVAVQAHAQFDPMGVPSRDPITKQFQDEFRAAGTPTRADLHFGSNWSCIERFAVKNWDRISELTIVFEDFKGMVRVKGSSAIDLMTLNKTGLVGKAIGTDQLLYFRVSMQGDLVGELQNPPSKRDGEPSVMDPSIHAFSYILCEASKRY